MNAQTEALREKMAPWLRCEILGEEDDGSKDGITPWDKCGFETKSYWLERTNRVLQACEEAGLQFAEEVGTTIYERQSDHTEVSQCILIPIDFEEAQQ